MFVKEVLLDKVWTSKDFLAGSALIALARLKFVDFLFSVWFLHIDKLSISIWIVHTLWTKLNSVFSSSDILFDIFFAIIVVLLDLSVWHSLFISDDLGPAFGREKTFISLLYSTIKAVKVYLAQVQQQNIKAIVRKFNIVDHLLNFQIDTFFWIQDLN